MTNPLQNKLVIGISTRALFDLDDANEVYEREGVEVYREYQRAHESEPLNPGTGLPLVRGLLSINSLIPNQAFVEVIIISRNHPDSAMRIFNSIEAHGLAITRGVFRGGRDPWPFLPAFKCDLFLSAEPKAVREALTRGTPAALVLRPPEIPEENGLDSEVVIAFDGDAVLFDEESDRIYQRDGPDAFYAHEKKNANVPLSPGPFRPFLAGLARIQEQFPTNSSPIRTALVTARNAPAIQRVINTFRAWNVRVDEACFLGGIDKMAVLPRLRPQIFFDDSLDNLEEAARTVPSAQVLSGVEQMPMFGEAAAPLSSRRARRRKAGAPGVVVVPPRRRPSRVQPRAEMAQPAGPASGGSEEGAEPEIALPPQSRGLAGAPSGDDKSRTGPA